jgi:hypothetical protein
MILLHESKYPNDVIGVNPLAVMFVKPNPGAGGSIIYLREGSQLEVTERPTEVVSLSNSLLGLHA